MPFANLRRGMDTYPSLRYVLPFGLFLGLLWVANVLPVGPAWQLPTGVLLMAVVCALCWPPNLTLRPVAPIASVLVGVAVFFLWIAPDVLIKNYRELFPFNNSIVGHIHSSLPPEALTSSWVLTWRFIRAALIVPVVEELFWRVWMMRWLIDSSFQSVPLGKFHRNSFLVVAVLFALEHGPYWDVGLLTGLIYNAWMVKTKSAIDCILVHAVTNACLSAYVLLTGQWQYWQ